MKPCFVSEPVLSCYDRLKLISITFMQFTGFVKLMSLASPTLQITTLLIANTATFVGGFARGSLISPRWAARHVIKKWLGERKKTVNMNLTQAGFISKSLS